MATVGRPLEDKELVEYILIGLDDVSKYFKKMNSLGDEMASLGRPIDNEELAEHILIGVDDDYVPLISNVYMRND